MTDRDSAQDIIDSYQKRQAQMPRVFVIGAVALVLIFAGIILLVRWFTNPFAPLPFFTDPATDTPTVTLTITATQVPPTETPLPPTVTPTITETPTMTFTPTIEGSFFYTVQEGDTCFTIAEQFDIDVLRLLDVNELDVDCVIFIGGQLLIPDPNEEVPTATPVPHNLDPGTLIQYRVQEGDNLTFIALQFNSTEEAILEANEDLENPNEIFFGKILLIPVNLVTPGPTATGLSASIPGSIITLTPTLTGTPTE